jgi:hypothetical protein
LTATLQGTLDESVIGDDALWTALPQQTAQMHLLETRNVQDVRTRQAEKGKPGKK